METLNYTKMIFSAIFGKPSSTPSTPKTRFQPPYKKQYKDYRETNIKTLELLCEQFCTPTYIKHICTNIYDLVNQNKFYSQDSQFRLIVICLYIAYKYESDDEYLITSELMPLDTSLTPEIIMRLELEVMDLIDWRISRKNSIYYIYKICSETLTGKKFEKIVNHACTLADLTLRMEKFLKINPKIIACTCIAFALKKFGAKHYWPKEFEKVSRVSINSIKIAELENKYNQVISAC